MDIDDDGSVFISAVDSAAAYAAKKMVDDICFVPEVGKLYYGKVVRILPIGAFVEIDLNNGLLVFISLSAHIVCHLGQRGFDILLVELLHALLKAGDREIAVACYIGRYRLGERITGVIFESGGVYRKPHDRAYAGEGVCPTVHNALGGLSKSGNPVVVAKNGVPANAFKHLGGRIGIQLIFRRCDFF